MIKRINTKTIKLIKFYKFINYNLIYNNKAINRYKKDTFGLSKDKAENLCREYLLHDSKDINFLSLLGTILLRKNDFEGAENYLRNVAKVAPAYPNVQEDLGTPTPEITRIRRFHWRAPPLILCDFLGVW